MTENIMCEDTTEDITLDYEAEYQMLLNENTRLSEEVYWLKNTIYNYCMAIKTEDVNKE